MIFSLLNGNIHRIQESLYPNDEIAEILSEQSWNENEYQQYRKWAIEWTRTDEIAKKMLIGEIAK